MARPGCGPLFSTRQRKMRVLALALLLLTAAGIFAATMASVINYSPVHDQFADPTKRLSLVHVIFRHGARTPQDTYPNDIYFNHTFSPYGWGHLTNAGRVEQYNLGKYLRQRYNSFLGNLFHDDIVAARSTDSTRAYMSCALTLAGMWPTKGTELDWNPDLNWSPIPIKSEPLNEDTLLLTRKNCSRYFEELENVMKLPQVEEILEENKNLFKELTEITGSSIKTPDDVQSLYSTLLSEKTYGVELPSWTENYYPDKLVPLTEISFELNAYNDELKRLKGGPLLKQITGHWTDKADDKLSPRNRKIFVYSGHDSTVSNFLIALGAWERQVPVFSVTVMLELYEDLQTGEYGVKVYLKKPTDVEAVPIIIKGCDEYCPLNKVKDLTKNLIPVNWEEECKSKDDSFVPPPLSGP